MPDDLDTDLVKALEDKGLNIVTYEAGNEEDRKAAVNSDFAGYRFSLPSSSFNSVTEVSRDTERMAEMNAYLEMVLDTVVQHEVTDKQINSIVDRIAKSCGAKLDSDVKEKVTGEVKKVYAYLNPEDSRQDERRLCETVFR